MSDESLSKLAAEKRREYKREWYARNKDKCREHTRRYWEKKVEEKRAQKEHDGAQP